MDDEVGYGNPPAATRFRKGQSGNPKGRPKGRHSLPPYENVLGQMLTIVEDGVKRQCTAEEAFGLHIRKRALEGDAACGRYFKAISGARDSYRESSGRWRRTKIVVSFVSPRNVNHQLEALRMATKLDRFRPSARMMLEPWIVQLALSRLGDRRLSRDQQATVVQAVRTPHKVQWPEWWEVRE